MGWEILRGPDRVEENADVLQVARQVGRGNVSAVMFGMDCAAHVYWGLARGCFARSLRLRWSRVLLKLLPCVRSEAVAAGQCVSIDRRRDVRVHVAKALADV